MLVYIQIYSIELIYRIRQTSSIWTTPTVRIHLLHSQWTIHVIVCIQIYSIELIYRIDRPVVFGLPLLCVFICFIANGLFML